ncbi:MAG: hypothetical protein GX591_11120 [Planctomycetes bacterium]|nr:hypothetical protein [Planctomycetota bacterium]
MNDAAGHQDGVPKDNDDGQTPADDKPLLLAYATPMRLVRILPLALGALLSGFLLPTCAVFFSVLLTVVIVTVAVTNCPADKGRTLAAVAGAWVLGLACAVVVLGSSYRPRPPHRWERCLYTNMRGICWAIRAYRADHGGAFPADLSVMVTTRHLAARHLECPEDATPGNVDYFYIPPAWAADPTPPPTATAVIVCDLRKNNPGWRNVAFLNGHAGHFAESSFQALLARPENAAFAAALRAAEGP